MKLAVLKLFHCTPHAALRYWCYALEFVAFVREHLCRKSLDWRSPGEKLDGETKDISIFRFPWFSPVWYYSKDASFPNNKMRKGYFLGINDSVGDKFSFYIVSNKQVNMPKPRVDI